MKLNINSIIVSKIGILNIGNNCFANSVLQLLIHNSYFINKFLNKIDKISNKDNSISYKLYLILYEMDNKDINKQYFDISNFLYLFGIKHTGFNGFIQKDAEKNYYYY